MRRLATIFLLGVFLFNALGFYGILVGLKWKNAREMSQLLSASDDVLPTRTFKVPLNIPYGVDSKDYEKVEGEFQFEGETYRLVKQRYLRDTLELVVVKDVKSQEINQALADYVKTFTDKPEHSKPSVKTSFDFTKDYLSTSIVAERANAGWSTSVNRSEGTAQLEAFYEASIIHPPQI